MNECPRGEIRDLLPDLMAGSLDEGIRARVEEHVRACADCAAELALLRTARAALSRGPAVDTAKIAASVTAARPVVARSGGSARVWRVAALAAAIVVMVAGGLWLSASREPQPGVAARSPESVAAPESASAPNEPKVAVTPRQAPSAVTSPVAPAAAPAAAPAEVALAVVTDDELGDVELEALLADIRSLDGLPDAEPSPDLPSLPAIDGEVQR